MHNLNIALCGNVQRAAAPEEGRHNSSGFDVDV
jgi:hypothetical protein